MPASCFKISSAGWPTQLATRQPDCRHKSCGRPLPRSSSISQLCGQTALRLYWFACELATAWCTKMSNGPRVLPRSWLALTGASCVLLSDLQTLSSLMLARLICGSQNCMFTIGADEGVHGTVQFANVFALDFHSSLVHNRLLHNASDVSELIHVGLTSTSQDYITLRQESIRSLQVRTLLCNLLVI